MINLTKKSREIFHKIHLKQKGCEAATDRAVNHIDTDYLRLDKNFFVGKKCVDLGCGSAAVGTVNMLNMNADFVYLSDADDSFFESAKEVLNSNKNFNGKWQANIADATHRLPYEDQSIDFALAKGFLHHLEDEQNVLSEIHRILKPNGKAYVDFNGSGGLINNFVMKTMREEYKKNQSFKGFIDRELSVKSFQNIIRGMKDSIENDNSDSYNNCIIFLDSLSKLIDEDLILTIEDRLYAPLYRQISEKEFINKFKKAVVS